MQTPTTCLKSNNGAQNENCKIGSCRNTEEILEFNHTLNVFIAWKEYDQKLLQHVNNIGSKLQEKKHKIFLKNLKKEGSQEEQNPCTFDHEIIDDNEQSKKCLNSINLIITIGGDGTILQTLSFFEQVQKMPWILSFQGGSFGFLCGFLLDENYMKKFENIIDRIEKREKLFIEKKSRLLGQLRTMDDKKILIEDIFEGKAHPQIHKVLNEFVISRGDNPNIVPLMIEISPNGFKDEQDTLFLTESIGDGLIISTPTGSTAYNLSAGGPIIQPNVNAIIMTPICPFSLSFRPLVLPSCTSIRIKVSQRKITKNSFISIDGKDGMKLGSYIELKDGTKIGASQEFIISYLEDDLSFIVLQKSDSMFKAWGQKLNTMLHWNTNTQTEIQSPQDSKEQIKD